MSNNIEGKVIVITGASSGLGEAAARLLTQAGARLALGARRLDRLHALAKELSLGDDAVVQTDVIRHDQEQATHLERAVSLHRLGTDWHRQMLQLAWMSLAGALALEQQYGTDGREELIAEQVRAATTALERLTGRVDVEDILDAIFRDFCIGK